MRHVLLLRGVNLGSRRRIAMGELRQALGDAGFADVTTHLQSGNIALSSSLRAAALEVEVSALISTRFDLEVPVLSRTARQLQAVLDDDPIPGAAEDPKRYQVTFLAAAPSAAAVERLRELAAEREQLVVHGHELYTWHPDGIARSKLAARLSAKELGVSATARNWTTVTTLCEMARG